MRQIILCVMLGLLVGCETDEKAITTVLEEVERGAIIRTVSYNNGEVYVGDENSMFSLNIEEQDILDGDLLESLLIYVSFIDRTPDNGSNNIERIELETLLASDFNEGPSGLPVKTLEYSYAELLAATGLSIDQTMCRDQFRLDLELNLTDGRIFRTTNSAGTVVNNSGFFKSPFTYLINIVSPIQEAEFTGIYFMEQIEEGPLGKTFPLIPTTVRLDRGHSNNVRTITLLDIGTDDSPDIEFSIACDYAEITRYQKTKLPICLHGPDPTDRILMGPDNPPGLVDEIDDTVFELYILEGFEGYNTECDLVDSPAKFRLTKQ